MRTNASTALSFSWRALLPAGGLIFLVAVALFVFSDYQARRAASFTHAEHSLQTAADAIGEIQKSALHHASVEAEQLTGATRVKALELYRQHQALWPDAVITYYDQQGEPITLATTGQKESVPSIPARRSIRGILEKNQAGQPLVDFSEMADVPAISAGAPVQGSFIKAVLVTVPLNRENLRAIEAKIHADIAVVSLDKAITQRAAGNLITASGATLEKWVSWAEQSAEPGKVGTMPIETGPLVRIVAMTPLYGSGGAVRGMLFSSPTQPAGANLSRHSAALYAVLALGIGLLGIALLLLWLRGKEQATLRILAEKLDELTRQGADALVREDLPAVLQKPFGNVAGLLSLNRELARKMGQENDTARCESPVHLSDELAAGYLRFFQASPHGIFQCTSHGKFLQVNPRFTSMLGYDSVSHMMGERPYLPDLCAREEEAFTIMAALKEQPNMRHAVTLSLRDGELGAFWLVTSTISTETQIVEGFVLDRSLNERYERARYELDEWQTRASSLSLLLAATCQQSQAYFAPGTRSEAEIDTTPAGDLQKGFERRKSINSLKAVFDDIYQIALTEAEGHPLVMVPIDIGRLVERTYRQALPAMQAQNIALSCDIAGDLTRVSGSAPLLRHALLRALLSVTAEMRGGCAYLSVMRDPNAPRTAGASRLLFSASWVSSDAEAAQSDEDAAACHIAVSITQPQNEGGETSPDLPPVTTLHPDEERSVIQFLVQKMQGDILETSASRTMRSFQFIVQLEHLVSGTEEAALITEAPLKMSVPVVEGTPLVTPHSVSGDFSGEFDAAPLNILVDTELNTGQEPPMSDKKPGLDLLLVDDSQNNRLLFSLFLRDTSHRITEARNGQEGVEAFQQKKFDVIFMDMEMPLLNGYQATRIIRALEVDAGMPPTPIVAQTAHVLPEFKQQCMISGCTEFLAKPFSKNALLSMLDAFAQMKQDAAPQA